MNTSKPFKIIDYLKYGFIIYVYLLAFRCLYLGSTAEMIGYGILFTANLIFAGIVMKDTYDFNANQSIKIYNVSNPTTLTDAVKKAVLFMFISVGIIIYNIALQTYALNTFVKILLVASCTLIGGIIYVESIPLLAIIGAALGLNTLSLIFLLITLYKLPPVTNQVVTYPAQPYIYITEKTRPAFNKFTSIYIATTILILFMTMTAFNPTGFNPITVNRDLIVMCTSAVILPLSAYNIYSVNNIIGLA